MDLAYIVKDSLKQTNNKKNKTTVGISLIL